MTAPSEPQRIVDALVAAGWKIVGYGRGYTRLAHADDTVMALAPSDPTAPEYGEMVDAVVANLASAVRLGDAARSVLDAMTEQGVIV